MAGKKHTLSVFGPLRDWGRKSKLILEKREKGRVVEKRQFVLDEAKGWGKSEKFQKLKGEAILNEATARMNQGAVNEGADNHLKMLEWAIILEREAQVEEVEVLKVDLEEAMERVLNLASQGFIIQEVDDKELVVAQIHEEEVEGEVVEKVDIWDEDEGSMATIRKSWVMRTPKKSITEDRFLIFVLVCIS